MDWFLMFERMERLHIKHGIYDDEYKVVYRADHDVTDEEVNDLIKERYSDYPVVDVSYRIVDGNELHVFYKTDCYD